MKYIKQFEHNSNPFKLYIVVEFFKKDDHSTPTDFYIFKTLPNSTQTDIHYNKFYFYDLENNLIRNETIGSKYHNYKDFKDYIRILYQSDNEKKALDELKMIENTKKFNL